MLKLNWKLSLGLVLVLAIMVLSGCTGEDSIEKYTLTVDIEKAASIPTIKVYDGGEEIVKKEGASAQFELSSGSYTLEVTADGYATETREITIDGSDETINLTLTASDSWDPGEGWTLAWSDEFDSSTVDISNWTRQELPAGTFNNEWQEYTDSIENCYIEDGKMVIEAKYNGNGFEEGNFTSARMITNEKVEYQYGKIAARIKVPKGQGIWPAFWMLGTNINETGGDTPWPECGEIDIMEKVGGSDKKETTVHGTVHYQADDGYNYIGDSKTISEYLADDYHVYEVEWNADTIIWRLDGEEYHRVDISSSEFDEFRQKFYILLNVAVGGDWPGYPDSSTDFPQRMYIDWVRVYK